MEGIFTAAGASVWHPRTFFFVSGEGHESNISYFLWILRPAWTSDAAPAALYPTPFGR